MLAPSSCSRRPHGIHRVAPVAGDPPDCMYIRVDQVWEDVRKEEGVTDGKTFGPLGTTTKGQLDEDIPGYGKFYCIACRCGDLTPPPTLSRAPTPRGNAGAPPRCLLAGCPGVPRGRGAEAAAHVSPRARLTGVGCATQ
mmetsp:Transcript_17699/g.57250  ORF Transcript_17699/g.57250 Transcript_17699/m.57250 type:complete len:139 (+) Transcript_17699:328-744(+)